MFSWLCEIISQFKLERIDFLSKNIFKKLCLMLSIILACSFIPSMVMCCAEKSTTQNFGEIEISHDSRGEGTRHIFCMEVENEEKLNFTTQLTNYSSANLPNFLLNMFECADKNCNNRKTECVFGSSLFNTTEPVSHIVEGDQLKNCNIDHFEIIMFDNFPIGEKAKFKSELTASTNSSEPLITSTCSAAASLIAPIGAIFATLLGLLAL